MKLSLILSSLMSSAALGNSLRSVSGLAEAEPCKPVTTQKDFDVMAYASQTW